MALFSAGSAFAAGIRGGCFALSIARLNMRLRKSLFSSLVKQEIGFFDVTQTGQILSRITSDTTIMSDTLALNVNVCLRSLITAKEVVSSMRTVRSFAGELAEVDRYSIKLLDTYRIQKRSAAAYGGYVWCSELFSLFLVVATLYYGGHLVISGQLSGGQLVSFILYQLQLGYAFDSVAHVYSGLMQAAGASEKVFQFINREPVIPNRNGLKPASLRGHLEFNNVTFAYPSRPETKVLKNVSFKVEPGEVVALVGPSGGGKSSCISLLEHFYETSSGSVLLDGIPIEQYDHSFLHEKV
ncbi:hypothetical protein LSH36_108g02009 [Paralvinella palmiformis]|uniref:ABC transmembrane type-1 domain-containing protein n=1 Tax=Paralvinella palmiformis TaxID=53620 RepID=A0AAD9K0Y1_9ANNE|nr:hypothetical protein LSH36_108g02009 [Paralvinella palmiformis]